MLSDSYGKVYDVISRQLDIFFAYSDGLKGKKIAIFPYGKGGVITRQILTDRYGVEPMIIDNGLASFNPKIRSLDSLTEQERKEYFVLITAFENNTYMQVYGHALRYFPAEQVTSIFGKVNTTEDTRLETFRLIARRIHELQLEGNVAEAGVYRGDFARNINLFFPEKKLYLFDTFEGFDGKDLKGKADERFESAHKDSRFDETSEQFVYNRMPFKEKVEIHKGFFPASAEGVEDRFCFVSLDMDIYPSTIEGLKWFWPRMVKNGYIMAHDYNNSNTIGCRDAINEFCENEGINLVPLADSSGTAVLLKI